MSRIIELTLLVVGACLIGGSLGWQVGLGAGLIGYVAYTPGDSV